MDWRGDGGGELDRKVPSRVYKYFDASGLLKTLQSHRLLVRPVTDYNDPFEFLFSFDPVAIDQVFDRFFEQSAHLDWLSTQVHLVGRNLSAAQLRLLLKHEPTERRRLFDSVLAQNQATVLEFAQGFQRFVAQKLGFVSFSCIGTEPLMWSHYADQHRGFVVGFELGDLYEAAKYVTYSRERVPFRHKSSEEDMPIEVIRTKSFHWAYEQEVRVICTETAWEQIEGVGTAGFLEFRPEQVSSVWAGIRADQRAVNDILEVLHSGGYSIAMIGSAELHPTKFEILLPGSDH